MPSPGDGDLFAAYRATTFEAHIDGEREPLAIRVGERCTRLDALLDAHGVDAWVYVTACNPGSLELSDDENARRNQALARELARCAVAVFGGEGRGDEPGWKPEPSFLALGLTLEDGVELGRRHGQNAIVAGRRGERARLVDCQTGA